MPELELFDKPEFELLLGLLAAVIVGGMIGMDRAYRGRAAGFRTHILVCMASSILMILMDIDDTNNLKFKNKSDFP